MLRRGTDDLWYVDEAKSWTYFHRFEDNVNFFVKYADNPFLGALRALKVPNMDYAIYGACRYACIARVSLFTRGGHPERWRTKFVRPRAMRQIMPRSETFICSSRTGCRKAIASYEKASALAPEDLTYRWRLMDLYLNASQVDKMLAELKYLSEHLPADRRTQEWYRYYEREYDFDRD